MRVSIPYFGGVVTAMDSRAIADYQASDMLNVDPESGWLSPRYGYRKIQDPQSGFTAAYGLEYIQGYNSSNALVEEYISFENLGVAVRPYTRTASAGVPTEITNGGSSLSLNASEWRGFAWNDVSYFTNPNDTNPVQKHTIGTNNSWSALTPPGSPTSAPTFRVLYGQNANSYKTLSWAGLNVATNITYTGNATSTNSSVTGTSLYIAHSGTITDSSIKMDLRGTTAGNAKSFDWYYCDNFTFVMESTTGNTAGGLSVTDAGFTIDPASVVIEYENDGGTTMTANLTYVFQRVGENGFRMYIRASFPDKVRADWGDGSTAVGGLNAGQVAGEIRYVTIKYRVTGGSSEAAYNFLRVQPIIIGGVILPKMNGPFVAEDTIQLAYSHYSSTTGYESGLSPLLPIASDALLGSNPVSSLPPLGIWLEVTSTNGSASDNNRYYIRVLDPADSKGKWKRMATQSDADLTYDIRLTWQERLALTTYQAITPFTATGCKFGVPWKGWVVWCYKGGYQNIKHSRVGEPEKQANTELDRDDDLNRGATFSLADNFGDEAENAFPADEVIIICGQNGIYSQQGTAPWNLTPPKKFPGSQGVAGHRACTRWKDDAGNPVVIFVSRTADGIYSAPIEMAADTRGGQVVPIDADIRGQVRTFLIDGQSALWTALSVTDDSAKIAYIRVWVDESRDALWVACGKRAMVLMRPGILSGRREWRFVEWTTASSTDYVQWVSSSPKRRVRWLRSTGRFDENEWNSNTSAWITGTNRDGNSPIASMYWTSKTFENERSRLDAVWLSRDDLTDTPTITAYCERQPSGSSRTYASGANFVRFSHLQSGWSHKLKIAIGEGYDPVRSVVMDNVQMAGRLVKTS